MISTFYIFFFSNQFDFDILLLFSQLFKPSKRLYFVVSLFAFLVTFLFQCAHEKEIKQKKVYPQSNILEGVQSAACPIYICKMRVPEIKTKKCVILF
ncbi:hypothetical protein DWY45_13165 [Phocaeicola plebeius]|nr:hypothetical protein DWY45_13165 [Phocaeicola plebeius]